MHKRLHASRVYFFITPASGTVPVTAPGQNPGAGRAGDAIMRRPRFVPLLSDLASSKLKLAGFKTFVDPITVRTSGNLVGIVGPNGCGKSNVID
ncbi:MAG: hypothetical protein LBP86_05890, partial [Azoarcus sp.]|nr:hypothetical protein [Azoarcus sp.]